MISKYSINIIGIFEIKNHTFIVFENKKWS